ncbi:CDP-alcohol phosphatidyltransferase family protein [Flavobacterium sp.]|uniref:CDP-alcohol phosphatidyltransferase family protein n=1 Tax=Flavobacterium sp. TaxID=239 RepID=UPI00120CFBA6|nr:CDP-alcohol phosphatidyltransferase family protein [Flavobacterium sp.]RZJ70876.1 MAG: phosphatidylserine synthase [Flavobacterium sp.]
MRLLRHLPNLLTLLNLFSGCIALIFAFEHNYLLAFLFVALGIFFDFFDGFFARMFKTSSELGLQLDSLADMVTSGVVPGLTMFFMLDEAVQLKEISLSDPKFWICLCGFIITLGSCMRLAKFNIDTRQTDSFIGLPTPANTLVILSLPIIRDRESFILYGVFTEVLVLLAITALSAFMLNAEIPLFSLKIKKFSFKDNSIQFVFLAICVLLLAFFQFAGVPLIILTYIAMSVINNRMNRK